MTELALLALLAVVAGWLGISFESAEAIAFVIIGCAMLVIVVRSAYRDAYRRQRWPGKNSRKSRSSL